MHLSDLIGRKTSHFHPKEQVCLKDYSTHASAGHFGVALLVFDPRSCLSWAKGIDEGIRGFKSAMTDQQKPVATSTNVVEDKS